MVNPPVYFKPTAVDMDKLPKTHQDNSKNVGPLIGKVGNLMVTQKPLLQNTNTQHRFASRPVAPIEQSRFNSASNGLVLAKNAVSSTSKVPVTIPSTTAKPQSAPTTTSKPQAYYDLPDEIPDDLRKQLEESGVLENAQISILDYDKIGDTSLQDLPPEHLANFFNAGGAAQIGASNKIVSVVKPNGESIQGIKNFSKKINEKVASKKEDSNLDLVNFDMKSQKTPSENANKPHSRYLPIKISGSQFPDVTDPNLRGKKIVSVVVLAPVTEEEQRQFDHDSFDSKKIKFISGEALKNLIKKPSSENFKKWLSHEQKTSIDLQSVLLLVTK